MNRHVSMNRIFRLVGNVLLDGAFTRPQISVTPLILAGTVLALAALSGCDGDLGGTDAADSSNNAASSYTVSGTVLGLDSGKTLTLLDNSGDALRISANGSFTFASPLATGASYAVTVGTQPAAQRCTATHGTGTMGTAALTGIAIACVATSQHVGGTVTGLVSGKRLTLLDNGGDALMVSANAAFTFSTPLASGAGYAVTVGTQPNAEACTVIRGTGTMNTVAVTNIAISCALPSVHLGGTVTGLTSGQSVQLQNNGSGRVTIAANGSFQFPAALAEGTQYSVTIGHAPGAETCTVANGSGTLGATDVSNVSVSCTPRPQFALVSNNSDNSISIFAVNPATAMLTSVIGSPVAELGTAGGPQAIAVSAVCPFAYVANNNDSNASGFQLDPLSGALTPIPGSPFSTGLFPQGVAISPDCARLYVTNNGDSTLSGFAIDTSSGALTPLAGSPFSLGMVSPYGLTFDGTGSKLYVADESANAVLGFSLDASTGAPSALSGSPYPAGASARYPSIPLNGLYLYVANANAGSVSAFAIDPASGVLTPMAGSPFLAGVGPFNVAINPAGSFAYVPNVDDNTISGYSIDASTGALAPLPGSPFTAPALNAPISLAINPTGTLASCANVGGNTIVTFAINPSTGTLSLSPAPPVATGSGPVSIAMSP